MSDAAPCGREAPSKSWSSGDGFAASIAGLPGFRWKSPADGSTTFGSTSLLFGTGVPCGKMMLLVKMQLEQFTESANWTVLLMMLLKNVIPVGVTPGA